MGKLWVVTCDCFVSVCPNRAAARQVARIANEHGDCPHLHTVLEADAWNLLGGADLKSLRRAVNEARRYHHTYANIYQCPYGAIGIATLPNREQARFVHNHLTQPRDYVVPVAAVEAAWNQRTFR